MDIKNSFKYPGQSDLSNPSFFKDAVYGEQFTDDPTQLADNGLPELRRASDDNFSGFLWNRLLDGGVRDNVYGYGLGLADGVSLGFTKMLRQASGIEVGIDEESLSYKTGDGATYVGGVAALGKGLTKAGGKFLRSSQWRKNSRTSRKTARKMAGEAKREATDSTIMFGAEEGVSEINDKITEVVW